jgi:transcriptional regulator with XRE-family HTH domain
MFTTLAVNVSRLKLPVALLSQQFANIWKAPSRVNDGVDNFLILLYINLRLHPSENIIDHGCPQSLETADSHPGKRARPMTENPYSKWPSNEKRAPFPVPAGFVFPPSTRKTLLEELAQKPYRDAYVAEHVRQGIAHQIRALREDREWKQGELSQALGKPQSVVSRLEDPSYGKVTVQTLLELASVFDVALQVRFVSYSSFLKQTRDLSKSSVKVAPFDKELGTSRKRLTYITDTNMPDVQRAEKMTFTSVDNQQISFATGYVSLRSATTGGMYAS